MNGTFTIALAPGASAAARVALPPCACTTFPAKRIWYETAVPAGIVVRPRLVTFVGITRLAPGKVPRGSAGASCASWL